MRASNQIQYLLLIRDKVLPMPVVVTYVFMEKSEKPLPIVLCFAINYSICYDIKVIIGILANCL